MSNSTLPLPTALPAATNDLLLFTPDELAGAPYLAQDHRADEPERPFASTCAYCGPVVLAP